MQMDERGSSMTDSSPLVRIKQTLTKLKSEISQMDVRVGVVRKGSDRGKLTYSICGIDVSYILSVTVARPWFLRSW